MKPFKSGRPVSQWLLRLALIAILFHIYFNSVTTLNFRNLVCIIALVALAAGIFNFIGGMMSKPWLTIICGLIIVGISVYKIIISFNGSLDHSMVTHFIPMALGFHFVAYGNDK